MNYCIIFMVLLIGSVNLVQRYKIKTQNAIPMKEKLFSYYNKVKKVTPIFVCTNFSQIETLCHLAGKDHLGQNHVRIQVLGDFY